MPRKPPSQCPRQVPQSTLEETKGGYNPHDSIWDNTPFANKSVAPDKGQIIVDVTELHKHIDNLANQILELSESLDPALVPDSNEEPKKGGTDSDLRRSPLSSQLSLAITKLIKLEGDVHGLMTRLQL